MPGAEFVFHPAKGWSGGDKNPAMISSRNMCALLGVVKKDDSMVDEPEA
jgi:hypothetical protein